MDLETILMSNIEIVMTLVLVDDEGTAYLVVAPPSSFDHSTRLRDKAKALIARSSSWMCTPVSGSKCELRSEEINEEVDNQSTTKRQKTHYTHEEDEAVVETAILARKGQLEKDAEQRAEIVFKQWCKEKKTLEQAIDETLRFGLTI
jgi:hypothetical protein